MSSLVKLESYDTKPKEPRQNAGSQIWQRLILFNTLIDSRFEDIKKQTWIKTTYRDMSAGLIVALTAIPMAMGFSMAMGLRPEQGIIAGALGCVIGRTWGGSKYQVYGPTAAFIPIIGGLIAKYGEAGGGSLAEAHGFLVFVSIIAGVILMSMGVFGLGKYAKLVPNSIIVGFTVGIAVAIALSNFESILGVESYQDLLGEDEDIKGGLLHNLTLAYGNIDKVNFWSVVLGLGTFFITKLLLRISIFIPAPLLAIATSTVLAATLLADKGVILVKDIYGSIPNNFFVFTPPILPAMTSGVALDIAYFVFGIVFVSAVESVLCSSMADRMANNRGTPFNPDKEFWGQGLVQVITPMVNGFPCTGALARTATSIKAGAVTPLAGYFKAIFKLSLAYYIASYLEMVPMACIGGILLWVASNMIKVSEIREVISHNRFHALLMTYTAIMVPVTDFLTGVLSALVIFFVAGRFFDKPFAGRRPAKAATGKDFEQPGIVSKPGYFNRVVIPLALTEHDNYLLRYAAQLTKSGIVGQPHFVFVETQQARAHLQPGIDPAKQMKQVVQQAFGSLEKATYQIVKAQSRLDTLVGYVFKNKIDLVLLGHQDHGNAHHSLAQRLAMLCGCSVWMVPENFDSRIQRIIAPIDFSPVSADSLTQAAAIAAQYKVPEILAIHVYDDESVVRYEEHELIKRGEEKVRFAEIMGSVDTHGVRINPLFMESIKAAEEILTEAANYQADLIVISTRGHSKAASILLGSVTSSVMSDAKIPVLAIKHYGAHLSLWQTLLSSHFLSRVEPKVN
ncbi:SulP family inorganic anion transporter [Methylomonas lenta]|uniref:SulP family inorganic anion transporter n=1 Tax=Methylomonas lenta TaxID=980561 RepID=UPI0009FE2C54|nr:SulP family inorganic anion transporter [Methylomonas lenta]